MKIYYDQEVDAAYLRLSKIVGIEILDATKKFPLQSLFTCEYEPKLMAGNVQ